MTIKKDIVPGTIIAKREIYGTRTEAYMFASDFYMPYGFISKYNQSIEDFDLPSISTYYTFLLKLKTRRARSKGVVVGQDMVPLLESMNIRLIPISHSNFFPILKNNHGFFSMNYQNLEKKRMYARKKHINTEGGQVGFTRHNYEYVDIDFTTIMPMNTKNLFGKYYIAVGLEVEYFRSHDKASADDPNQVSSNVQKYYDGLNNQSYLSLLEKNGNSILEGGQHYGD